MTQKSSSVPLGHTAGDVLIRLAALGWVEGYTHTSSGPVVSWNGPDGSSLAVTDGGTVNPLTGPHTDPEGKPVGRGGQVAFHDAASRTLQVLNTGTGAIATALPAQVEQPPPVWLEPGILLVPCRGENGWALMKIDVRSACPAVTEFAALGPADTAPQVHAAGGVVVAVVHAAAGTQVIALCDGRQRVLIRGSRSVRPLSASVDTLGEQVACVIRTAKSRYLTIIRLDRGQAWSTPVRGLRGGASWGPGGGSVVVAVTEWPVRKWLTVDLSGAVEPFSPTAAAAGPPLVAMPGWHAGRWWFVGHGVEHPPALFSAARGGGDLVRHTPQYPALGAVRWRSRRIPSGRGHDVPVVELSGRAEAPAGSNVDGPAEQSVAPPPGVTAGRRGSVVVMLHGGPASSWQLGWDPVAVAVLASGRRVVLVEPVGSTFDGWPLPALRPGRFGVDDVDDVYAVVQESHPDRVSVFGHSYGGYLGYRTSLREPPLLASLVMTSGYLDPLDLSASGDRAVLRFREHAFGPPAADAWPTVLPATCPVLTVHGLLDAQSPSAPARQNVNRLTGSGHQLCLLPGEGHGYRRRTSVIGWLTHALAFLDLTNPSVGTDSEVCGDVCPDS